MEFKDLSNQRLLQSFEGKIASDQLGLSNELFLTYKTPGNGFDLFFVEIGPTQELKFTDETFDIPEKDFNLDFTVKVSDTHYRQVLMRLLNSKPLFVDILGKYVLVHKCIDCRKLLRDGMFLEDGNKRCIYCYNLKTSSPYPVNYFIEVANRKQHENEIKMFVDPLCGDLWHEYYTNSHYELVVSFEWTFLMNPIIQILEKLEKSGIKCGVVQISRNRFLEFTVDFVDHKRRFTR